MGMATWHSPGADHTGLPPNLQPVVRSCIPLERSAPRAGLPESVATWKARIDPYGKHCDHCLYQPARWPMLQLHIATRPQSPPLESKASDVASYHSYSGFAQLCTTHTYTLKWSLFIEW